MKRFVILSSFTTEVVYDISTEQGVMTTCSCIGHQRNRCACKYVYSVYHFNKSCAVHSQGRLSQ